MLGEQCIYDKDINCFRGGECNYVNALSCLKNALYALTKEREKVKKTMMRKHTDASITWRNQAFYYKKVNKLIRLWATSNGVNVPSVAELEKFHKSVVVVKSGEKGDIE